MHLQLPNQVSWVLKYVVQQACCFRERSMLFWCQESAFTCLHVKFRMVSCKLGKIWCCATHCMLFAEGKTDGYSSQTCVSRQGGPGNCLLSQWGEDSKRGGILDEMVKQVDLFCVPVKCLSPGCMQGYWSRSCSLDLKCCCDFSSSLKHTVLPKSVSLAERTLYVVQTLLS